MAALKFQNQDFVGQTGDNDYHFFDLGPGIALEKKEILDLFGIDEYGDEFYGAWRKFIMQVIKDSQHGVPDVPYLWNTMVKYAPPKFGKPLLMTRLGLGNEGLQNEYKFENTRGFLTLVVHLNKLKTRVKLLDFSQTGSNIGKYEVEVDKKSKSKKSKGGGNISLLGNYDEDDDKDKKLTKKKFGKIKSFFKTGKIKMLPSIAQKYEVKILPRDLYRDFWEANIDTEEFHAFESLKEELANSGRHYDKHEIVGGQSLLKILDVGNNEKDGSSWHLALFPKKNVQVIFQVIDHDDDDGETETDDDDDNNTTSSDGTATTSGGGGGGGAVIFHQMMSTNKDKEEGGTDYNEFMDALH